MSKPAICLDRYLASHGVRHVELLGRSGHLGRQADESALAGLIEGAWGGAVTITKCDTASAEDMRAVLYAATGTALDLCSHSLSELRCKRKDILLHSLWARSCSPKVACFVFGPCLGEACSSSSVEQDLRVAGVAVVQPPSTGAHYGDLPLGSALKGVLQLGFNELAGFPAASGILFGLIALDLMCNSHTHGPTQKAKPWPCHVAGCCVA